jgi:hypothetical protein
MLITTTPNIEGKRIKEYLGIVTGEAVLGANLFRDLFAGLRDIVGGRSGAYEKELRKARNLAFEEITEAAQRLERAWWKLPRWLRDESEPKDRIIKAKGGGWTCRREAAIRGNNDLSLRWYIGHPLAKLISKSGDHQSIYRA